MSVHDIQDNQWEEKAYEVLTQALSKKVMKKWAQKEQLSTYNLTLFTSTLKMQVANSS